MQTKEQKIASDPVFANFRRNGVYVISHRKLIATSEISHPKRSREMNQAGIMMKDWSKQLHSMNSCLLLLPWSKQNKMVVWRDRCWPYFGTLLHHKVLLNVRTRQAILTLVLGTIWDAAPRPCWFSTITFSVLGQLVQSLSFLAKDNIKSKKVTNIEQFAKWSIKE